MGVFVVQVISGQEDRAAALIAKIAQGAVKDCFVPKREVMHRKSGQWHRILEKLFPGYVFVRTGTPEQVREALGRVPAFTRMLTSAGDTCLPLTADEVAWINSVTNADTHVMEMSEGVIEGGSRDGDSWTDQGSRGADYADRPAQAPGMGGYGHVWTT